MQVCISPSISQTSPSAQHKSPQANVQVSEPVVSLVVDESELSLVSSVLLVLAVVSVVLVDSESEVFSVVLVESESSLSDVAVVESLPGLDVSIVVVVWLSLAVVVWTVLLVVAEVLSVLSSAVELPLSLSAVLCCESAQAGTSTVSMELANNVARGKPCLQRAWNMVAIRG